MKLFRLGLLLLLQGFCDATMDSSDALTCKDTVPAGNASKIIVECWIRSSATLIPCKSNWDTLHLEVLSEQNQSDTLSLRQTLFNHCGQLRVLAIWEGGPLTHLQRELFHPLYNLQRLVIRAGNLRYIEKNLLLFLPNLQLLSITDSKSLKRLGTSTLEPLPSQMTTLDLSNNKLIDVLQPRIFGNHPLRNLYLQNNKITGLYEESLLGLSELRLLRISGNHLTGSLENALGAISPNSSSALLSVPQLEILDLASNYLTEINGCKWSGGYENKPALGKLRVLNLAKNRLTWIDPEAFRGLPRLTELRLEGNHDLFHTGSLPVVLFSFTRDNYPALKHLAIPQESPVNGVVEMCSDDPLQTSSRIILSAIEHLNKQFCEEVVTDSMLIAVNFTQPVTNSTQILDISDNEGPVFFFIRKAKGWVLNCIAIGLLLTGVLISGIIFACFYWGVQRSPTVVQEDSHEAIKPAIVYAPSNMSLHNFYTPEGYCQAYFPIVQSPLNKNVRYSGLVTTNGTPLSNLNRHRNTSHSVYSLLSAPPNTTPVMPISSTNLINLQPTGIKQAAV
nr:Leucine rich repeat typical subtype [Hymenolepis microstoma]